MFHDKNKLWYARFFFIYDAYNGYVENELKLICDMYFVFVVLLIGNKELSLQKNKKRKFILLIKPLMV